MALAVKNETVRLAFCAITRCKTLRALQIRTFLKGLCSGVSFVHSAKINLPVRLSQGQNMGFLVLKKRIA